LPPTISSLLATESEEAARDLADAPALAMMAERPGLCVEAAGADLILFLSGQELAVEALPALMRSAEEISAGLPPHRVPPGNAQL
jgi:hypothetical protein